MNPIKIAVAIPCYKVSEHIENVIKSIPEMVETIYCIDDACPEKSYEVIERIQDKRIKVLRHEVNMGVGAAVIKGYRAAMQDDIEIVIKIDGDGQMDPSLIPVFIEPIISGECDYTKGNRFYRIDDVKSMPKTRLFGNAILSFITKLSSGYWNLFDPTNGYTAVHTNILKEIPLEKISKRYFFESDMLFRLNTVRAVISDIPMKAVYEGEESNLKISKILLPFISGHIKNFYKRILYNYFLRDFNIASIELLIGVPMLLFGIIFGANKWIQSINDNMISSPGTVMLGALPVIIGMQLILSFLQYDIRSVPTTVIYTKLISRKKS